jgi:two-component system nitrogen regulation sensor histidine kinase NtrY
MVYKHFRFQVILRILLLFAFLILLLVLLLRSSLYSLIIIAGGLTLYQVYSLIRYVEKTNRDLARFFQAIRYSDFSQSFKSEKRGSSFDALEKSFTAVINAFRKTRAEKEEHYRYLQTVVEHVGVGLIVFQPKGEVELVNNAAKKLLQIARLKNIHSLRSLSPQLVETLLQIKPRESSLVKVDGTGEALQLTLYATEFKLRGQVYRLVSIQNIQSELEEKELESWQKLIRVLTHEIMNSVTPISSLASTAGGLLHESAKPGDPSGREIFEDIREAVRTIEKRSQGLLHFVDAYRNLTLIQKPKFQICPVGDLFSSVHRLMQANILEKSVTFRMVVEPETLELTADPELVEQVLINLMLNALQAVERRKKPAIEMNASLDKRGRILIQVTDNGPGISEEELDKVFIPFYSTKEAGSGIGLSLSRQIMRLHRGTIGVQSEPEKGTVFTLRF